LTGDIPWSFIFSFVAAVGSGATAAGFILIRNQTKLTKKQIDQTHQEIGFVIKDNTGYIVSYTVFDQNKDNLDKALQLQLPTFQKMIDSFAIVS
jgi:hypothetical protein